MSELLSSHSRDAATITARHAAGPETRTLPLLQGRTSLAEALEEEENMLFRLAYPSQRTEFYVWILQHRKDFEAIVSHHLSLASNEICQFAEVKDWRPGSFNVCIPISIDNWRKHPGRRVLLRIPLPYKVGESACPGNADEKLRTEAATFIWIGCPDIPIPYLWGFGLPGGRSVCTLASHVLTERIHTDVHSSQDLKTPPSAKELFGIFDALCNPFLDPPFRVGT